MTSANQRFNFYYEKESKTCELGTVRIDSLSDEAGTGLIPVHKTSKQCIKLLYNLALRHNIFFPVSQEKIPKEGLLMISDDYTKQSVLMENGEVCVLNGAIPELVPTRVPPTNGGLSYVNGTFYNCGGLLPPLLLFHISTTSFKMIGFGMFCNPLLMQMIVNTESWMKTKLARVGNLCLILKMENVCIMSTYSSLGMNCT